MGRKKSMIAVIIVILVVLLLFAAYNLFRFPARLRSLEDNSLDSGQVEALRDEIRARQDKHVLVACFSYSGTTRGVAEALRERTGADLFEIAPEGGYSNVYLQSNSEIRSGARPELTGTVENMEDYDIVFVGYPVWFHATPAPVNSWLRELDLGLSQ
nr:flavodoxin [uncultured Lachnoclostridium sp.]